MGIYWTIRASVETGGKQPESHRKQSVFRKPANRAGFTGKEKRTII